MNHEGIKIFDIRSADAYKSGHIVDAQRISKDEFSKNNMQKLKESPLALVCDTGTHSTALASEVKKQGFGQVMVLHGGIRSWQDADLPLVKGK